MLTSIETRRLFPIARILVLGVSGVVLAGCSAFESKVMTPLIGEDGLADWQGIGGSEHTWMVAGDVALNPADDGKTFVIKPGSGVIVNGRNGRTADIVSTEEFGDMEAHIEFSVARGSNSGVYFMGKYEIQILDSYGKEDYTAHDCGAIYERWKDGEGYEGRPPLVNASRPAGEWQTFDVIFKAPRFDEDGNKIANARFVKVVHNGKVIHKDVELSGPTRGAMGGDAEVPTGPLRLQGDHGPVAFRNIMITKRDVVGGL